MSKPKSGGAALQIDEGAYPMTIVGVWDIGTQTQKGFGKNGEEDEEAEKEVPQLIVEAEVPEYDFNGKAVRTSKEKPSLISMWLTNSGSDRSKLYALKKACGIKNPGSADNDELLGKSFVGNVEHTESGKAKIKTASPLTKGQKVGKVFRQLDSCYLDETFDPVAFERMPKFAQDKAITTKEYEAVEAAQKNKKGKRGK